MALALAQLVRDYAELDFTRMALDSRVSFTRASDGTYFDAAGVMQTAGTNAPRFDHDPVTGARLGLLIEDQRTNSALWSQEFDQATWVKVNGTVLADAATAPNGTMTADLFSENSALGAHGIDESITVVAGLQTISVFVRYAGRQWIRIDPYGSASPGTDSVWFDIQNGVKGAQQANCTGTITPVGAGWYRITWTATCLAGALQISLRGSAADNSTSNYAGSGAAAFYVWGAQLEAGSFVTSYIPTTNAAMTRAADTAVVMDLRSIRFNASEGTLFADAFLTAGVFTNEVLANLLDGTVNNYIRVIARSDGIPFGLVVTGGATQASISVGSGWSIGQGKLAIAYRTNDVQVAYNGAASAVDTSAALPSVDRLGVGMLGIPSGGQQRVNGCIRRIRYYPRRLNAAELQRLTA